MSELSFILETSEQINSPIHPDPDPFPFPPDVMVLNDIINQAAAPRGSADAGSASATTASRKISMFLNNDDGDEGPNIKEKLVETVYKLIDIFCVWDCCHAYIRLSEVGRGRQFVRVLRSSFLISECSRIFYGYTFPGN